MPRLLTTLITDDSGDYFVTVKLSPQNPTIIDVPLVEYLEEYERKQVTLVIEPVLPLGAKKVFVKHAGTITLRDGAPFIDDVPIKDIFKPYENKEIRVSITERLPTAPPHDVNFIPDIAKKAPDTTLWYSEPASQFVEALPIGNGHLAAMVYGGINNERILLNEDSIWYGGPRDRVNPDALKHLPEVRRLLLDQSRESMNKAHQLTEMALHGVPACQYPYQTLGEWVITMESGSSNPINYARFLDLATGTAQVRYELDGAEHTREYFCSYPDNVIIARIAASNGKRITCHARFVRKRPFDGEMRSNGKDQVSTFGQSGPSGVIYRATVKATCEGGTVSTIGETIVVQGASVITWLISAETSFRNADLIDAVDAHLSRVVKIPYIQLKANHLKDYQSLFNRVSLSINPAQDGGVPSPTDQRLARVKAGERDDRLVCLYFQFGRYLLMSSSRAGSLPANLQGKWNESLTPPWDSKYTININTEMNYWPAEPCNLGECVLPLADHVERMQKNGERTAKVMYGARGWVAHHNTDLWADTAPVDRAVCATWPLGGAWLSLHLWEHYLFSQDLDFLAKRAYPVMKGAAEFFIDYLFPGPDGHLLSGPSVSPENTYLLPDGTPAQLTVEAAMDSEIIRELITAVLSAASVLKVDQDLCTQLDTIRSKLLPLKIGKHGQLQEWGLHDYDEAEPGHRHMSHLFALHPGAQISTRTTPDLAQAVFTTLQRRIDSGGGHTGWSCAWIINFWARLHEAEYTREFLTILLGRSTYPNMFDAHPPFQIDGNLGGTAGIAEMLLQSHEGEILLLPALPDAWEEGDVKGLRARGDFTINIAWKKHVLESATIAANRAGQCRVRSLTSVDVVLAGKPVAVQRPEPDVVVFTTAKGKTYELKPA
nr:glycoside hydrolase family 95 protein [Candidatus Sigynarchaeota archaeon]